MTTRTRRYDYEAGSIELHIPPMTVGSGMDPIGVTTAADAERLKQLVQQAANQALDAGIRAGIEWGVREGMRLGIVEGGSASVDEVVEAFLASPRARRQMTVVKDVERDPEGRVVRVVERPA